MKTALDENGFKSGRFKNSLVYSVVLSVDVHTVKSLAEEMENDSSTDEMVENDPAEQEIGKRLIGESEHWGLKGVAIKRTLK